MSELTQAVSANIRKHRLFLPGERILVAVSGGLDSMVLLHLLQTLSKETAWQLTVAHLNHQLRGASSNADERLVRRTAEALKLPVVVERADVRKLSQQKKLSLEMAARKARHEFFARTAARLGIRVIAAAHHADDQLELFFLRLLRGSGAQGLAGMKWKNPSPVAPRLQLVRPFLNIPKTTLRAYAVRNKIRYREDASNACLDILRNRVRHQLLPLLKRRYQPALSEVIRRTVEILSAETEFADQAAAGWLQKVRHETTPARHSESKRKLVQPARPQSCQAGVRPSLGAASSVRANRGISPPFELSDVAAPEDGHTPPNTELLPRPSASPSFQELHVALQRRVVQAQLLALGILPDYELVEKLRTVPGVPVSVSEPVTKDKGAQRHVPALREARQVSVFRDTPGVLHLGKAISEPGDFIAGSFICDVSSRRGSADFDGIRLRWKITNGALPARLKHLPGSELFDADKVCSPVILRHWQPGDRFQPIGMHAPVKLQDLFTNQRVPRARRRELVLATNAQGEIFWVEGLRISERFKLTSHTIRRLHWAWERL